MIEIARADARHVTLYTTFSLGLAAITVSRIPLSDVPHLHLWVRLLLCLGIVSLAGASAFYFSYVRKLHVTQMRMARCLPTLDTVRVRELWAGEHGVWARNKWRYVGGQVALVLGVVCIGAVLCALYITGPHI